MAASPVEDLRQLRQVLVQRRRALVAEALAIHGKSAIAEDKVSAAMKVQEKIELLDRALSDETAERRGATKSRFFR